MKKELETKYNPKDMEGRIYDNWLLKKYFHPEVDASKTPFTIVIPPPNVTGNLHMGHALDLTMQDILIRYKRMKGFNALWIPGSDHASISTEVKVVNKLLEDGIKKEDITRDEFLKHAWEWKETYENNILNQVKKLGCSCDWDRTRFTLDEGLNNAVYEVFINLYNEGLIYKGEKLINWCTKCKTTISDAEVDYEDKSGNLYHIKYQIEGSDEYLVLATTRPETMFGDVAVAVNPNDERYKKYIGKNVVLPVTGKAIPIVGDEHADPEFGTGVVKITPAHDPNDYEVGKRHNLPTINVMNDDGTMNEAAGKYQGMDRYVARKAVLDDLKDTGMLIKTEEHMHNVGVHERCREIVEPLIKSQWFVAMEELAGPAIEVYEKKELRFVPDRFGKIYMNWLTNIKDWCISRQLWWGHRIPAYYCDNCDNIVVGRSMPEMCGKCGHTVFHQDEDVLDTWFSSALWPFSTLGWPEETEDYKYFFPTDVLVTGYDIIFFWVVRMVFSSLKQTGKLPFKDVVLHGLIRDKEGRKMSKSLGNGIDPIEMVDLYGADALRMSLISSNSPGNDMRFYTEKVESARNFANKIWNATRFIMMNMDDYKDSSENLEASDKWILTKLNRLIKEVETNIENYDLGIATAKIEDFLWSEYCDYYIEMVKPRLREPGSSKNAAIYTLLEVLSSSMKLLHPFMPFITEEIFKVITDEESIMISDFPEESDAFNFLKEESEIDEIKEVIREIRNVRAEKNIAPSKKIKLVIDAANKEKEEAIQSFTTSLKALVNADEISFDKEYKDNDAVNLVTTLGNIYLPMSGLINKDEELKKLEKEKVHLNKEIEIASNKLSNEGFTKKAPKDLIKKEEEKLEGYKDMLDKVLTEIKKLEG